MTFIPGIGDTAPLTGPLVLGYMLGCMLFGVLAMQVYSYYNNFPDDSRGVKWLVGTLFFLELAGTIFNLINAWVTFGSGWGDTNTLLIQHWSLTPLAPLSGITASIVQFFFAYRIFKLTRKVYLPIIICAISLLQCFMVMYVGITNILGGRSFKAFYELSTFISIWLAGDAVCDILIAVSTVTILVNVMRKSHFRNTDTSLKRLIRLTVETGLITASGATLELILWQAEKFLNYHYIFFLVLGKLYSNAMLAALNSRIGVRQSGRMSTGTTSISVGMNSGTGNHHLTLFEDEYRHSSSGNSVQLTTINVVRHVDVRQDSDLVMDISPAKNGFGVDAKSKVSDYT